MKVAIVGASGHVGTALLRALDAEEHVTDIVGIARRLPDATADPYRAARWERIDIALPADDPVADGHRVPVELERELLGLYLSDHLTGATAGTARIRRMATGFADTDIGPELARLADEIATERAFLRQLIPSLELRRRPYRQAVAWLAERVGRLKTNGRVTGSPMTPVLELELMRGAVVGKAGAWETLEDLAPQLGLPAETFRDLADRARAQEDTLQRLHAHVRADAFRHAR